MVPTMMLDLMEAERPEERHACERAIDGVAVDVREPMGDLESQVMQKTRGEENQRSVGGQKSGQKDVVGGEENREDP